MSVSVKLAAWLVAGLSCALPSGHARASSPSFDCAKATLQAEKTICADQQLSAIDALIAKAYKGFEPSFGGDKRQIAKALVADRNACGSDAACIVSAQTNALDTFGTTPRWVEDYNEALIGRKASDFGESVRKNSNQPLPASIGQCAITHIETLSTRLGDDPLETAAPEAGSAASFTNGGSVVSYDREPGLSGASVGDPAVLCLMSIPRDCPAGDTRGRVYYGLDTANGGTWVLPDSQHMCGGA